MDYLQRANLAKNLLIRNVFKSKAPTSIVGFGVGNKVIEKQKELDTGVPCVRVYVSRKLPREEVAPASLLPQEILGVPIDVITVRNRFRPDGHVPVTKNGPANVLVKPDAIKPGISIAADTKSFPHVNQLAVGTLGAVLRDAQGVQYLLSCNHVLASKGRVTLGTDIFAPAPLHFNGKEQAVAQLTGSHPIERIQEILEEDNTVDCAIARIHDSWLANIDPTFDVSGSVAEWPGEPRLGQKVVKLANTTRRTKGKVVDINADILVEYGFGEFRFRNQILVEGVDEDKDLFAADGDSGAVLLAEPDAENPEYRAVGLIYAPVGKLTAACRMTNVLNLLGQLQGVAPPLALLTKRL